MFHLDKQIQIAFALFMLFVFITTTCHSSDLYVATNGDDVIPYDLNSIDNPWKSIAKGIYSLKAGDTLYIRGGNYTPPYPLRVRNDYDNKTYKGDPRFTMNAESGTKELPVTITAYNNEEVIVDLDISGKFISLDNKSYWTFENLNFINGGMTFFVGENHMTKNNVLRNLYIKSKYGGDNYAAIHLVNGNAEGTIIENNVLIGPGINKNIHLNTSLIYLKTIRQVKILNNEISNAPIGIYYKHITNMSGSSPIDIEIAYNLIKNTSRNAISLNANYAKVHNNIFGLNNSNVTTSNANGGPGGDNNTFENNTFYSGRLILRDDTEPGDQSPGSQNNTVTNNIFNSGGTETHYYNNSTPHNTKFSYNMYLDGQQTHFEAGISYNLNDWITHSGTGIGSIVGTPLFAGGEAPKNISDYALTPESQGYNADSRGNDMGANTDFVGSSISVSTNAPSPVNIIVK